MKQLCNYRNKLFSSWGETEEFAWNKAVARLTVTRLSRSLKILDNKRLDKVMSGLVTSNHITDCKITNVFHCTLNIFTNVRSPVVWVCLLMKKSTYSWNNQISKFTFTLAKQTRWRKTINYHPLFNNHRNIFDSMTMSFLNAQLQIIINICRLRPVIWLTVSGANRFNAFHSHEAEALRVWPKCSLSVTKSRKKKKDRYLEIGYTFSHWKNMRNI